MRIPRCHNALLAIAVICLAGVFHARAETMNLNLKFESTKQSMWGPGTAATPGTVTLELVPGILTDGYPASWNGTLPGSYWPGKITKDTWFWGDVTFGVDGRASTSGDLRLLGNLNFTDAGSVDVTYPVEPSLTFPDQNDFVAGDIVSVTSSYERGEGWALTTRSPSGTFTLDGTFKASIDLFASICFIGCIETDDEAFQLWPGEKLEIDSTVDFPELSPLLEVASGVLYEKNTTYVGASAMIPEVHCFRGADAATGCDSTASDELKLQASGWGKALSGQEPGVFATANIHVAAIIKKAIEKKYKKKYPWIEWLVLEDKKKVLSYATVDWTIVAIDLQTLLRAEQQFAFTPDLKVKLQFPRDFEYWFESAPGKHETGTFAEMRVGEKIYIQTPSDSKEPMSIVPTFRLDNEFSAKTVLKLKETLPVRVADLDVELPEITIIPELCTPGGCTDLGLGEVCVPKYCTDPVTYDPPDFGIPKEGLFDHSWSLTSWIHLKEFPTASDQKWQLEGFAPQTVQGFALDPENPIIRISQVTGLITRPGAGRRIVPFVIDFWNGGDVPLGSLALQSSLQNAFPGVFSVTLDRVLAFGVTKNVAYDGKQNAELLAPPVFIGRPAQIPPPGNAVLVGAPPKRLIVYANVYPRPDPPTFTSNSSVEAASPLHTEVTATASSTANLGPWQPKSAADFVLFGAHFVKLQSAGRIYGDVGSNDFVEVKQGASANVGGDLRAGRVLRVSGSISADYAFSGGIIDIVGKGALRLYGSKKEFQKLRNFTLTSPPFAPSTPLLGDVWVPAAAKRKVPAGHYGDITVLGGGTLFLGAGTSHIRSLHLESGAVLKVAGPATLILNDMVLAPGAVLASSGWSRDVAIHALQTWAVEIGSRASIRGALVAPRANVIFGQGSRLEGSAYGKSITLAPGASATFHRQCDTAVDGNCDGKADDPSAGS